MKAVRLKPPPLSVSVGGGQVHDYCNHFNLDINDDKWLNPTEEEAPSVGENEDIIFTDGSTGAADITAPAETADAG